MIGLHLISFFAGALVCHRQLADRRPAAVHLTEFYLWLSFGGMLGGVFNTLVAPRVFKGVFEYPLVLALACLLRPPTRSRKGKLEPWPWFVLSGGTPLAVGAVMWGSGAVNPGTSPAVLLLLAAGVSGVIWALANRRAPFNVFMVAAALAPVSGATGVPGEVLFAGRSFFGVVRVIDRPKEGYHLLQHGTTVHGRQDTRVQTACAPLSYFHPSGPIGQVFAASASRFDRVAVVGLGTGALACYAEPGQRMTFFEIDPLIERVARDPQLFTFLRNARGVIDIQIGDGRKKLEEAPAGAYNLIVLDAFNSDAVPVHLLTREALRSYVSRLQPEGIIAVHISNRFLDLEPALGATLRAERLFALVNLDGAIPQADRDAGRLPSHWVVMAREAAPVRSLCSGPGWKPLRENPRVRAWTDDYSNLMQALKLGWRSD